MGLTICINRNNYADNTQISNRNRVAICIPLSTSKSKNTMNRILTLYLFLLLCGTASAQRTVEWNDLQTLTDDARRTVYYKKDSNGRCRENIALYEDLTRNT